MKITLMFIIAYLLGSIPSGVWVGKKIYGKDIRQFGSGNSGTTNTFRVLGKTAGTVVLLADVLKGTLAACLPLLFQVPINPMVIGLGAILGHTYPLFAQFKGGKAVATSAGVLLAYNPPFFIYSVCLFLVLLFLTRMVSLSSMISLPLITLSSLFIGDWILTTIAFILTLFIIYRHRENIKRIRNGTESKVPFGLGYKKDDKDSF
ncbi:glycerol-3-phosphate 1-O-acyltransferase PlsY [Carnobacterium viridans]|uniref:glycerol-3-phosphate 1-O-acyltransferase PlsY n=1 Tax=Carnobacterium viridans TaxID=174587 RepID=UPI0005540193|nr:glycerol-3-phosphate 1-O-acyltransferase PlsY [Carnobacterium viridans]UDE96239.1 glycerol-3-phosphate 1-O-acyltransferase PlsY [Carnobacterium viridans]